jgi:hypothetical protein
MGMRGQLHTPPTVLPGKEHPVPIKWEAGWAPEVVWIFLKRKNNIFPYWNSKHNSPFSQSVT